MKGTDLNITITIQKTARRMKTPFPNMMFTILHTIELLRRAVNLFVANHIKHLTKFNTKTNTNTTTNTRAKVKLELKPQEARAEHNKILHIKRAQKLKLKITLTQANESD